MPLFLAPLPTPTLLYTPAADASNATTAVVAGTAYFSPVMVNTPLTITQMRCYFSGTPTGNVDLGIYDSTGTNTGPGNLLGHTGAHTASSGLFTQNMTANLLLSPGLYWLAFLDTVADTPGDRSINVGTGSYLKTTATNLTVLPATAGTVTDSTLWVSIFALLPGGFS